MQPLTPQKTVSTLPVLMARNLLLALVQCPGKIMLGNSQVNSQPADCTTLPLRRKILQLTKKSFTQNQQTMHNSYMFHHDLFLFYNERLCKKQWRSPTEERIIRQSEAYHAHMAAHLMPAACIHEALAAANATKQN